MRLPSTVTLALVGIWLALAAGPLQGVELVRHISRENPLLNIPNARLAVGRDGNVYLATGEYVLRVSRDGSARLGGKVTYALWMAAANGDGVIATANGHFSHSVNLWSPAFEQLGGVNEFLNNDQVEYMSPSDVQAGPSGDFYGIDQNRNRIIRIAAPGRMITTYSLASLGEDLIRKLAQFRVWEAGKRFYVLCPSGTLRVVGFDGKPLWSLKPEVGGNPWDGWRGGFDVDDAGRLFVIANASDVVKIYDSEGKPAGEVKLQMGERKGRIADLRVFGDDILVKRPHPVELFQVYDRTTGAPRGVIRADVEQLTVTIGSDAWTAGDKVPLRITLDAGRRDIRPDWRVWLRPLNHPTFQELPLRDDAVHAPADGGGFYQLRVSAGRAGADDEYMVETVVSIRQPGAKGSVSLFTPHNRLYYGQGEAIPVSVLCRAMQGTPLPESLTVRLQDGSKVLAEGVVRPKPGAASTLLVPPSLSAALRAGEYILTTEAPGFTVAPQTLVIGPGLRRAPAFSIVQHGDYHDGYPKAGPLDTPEKVAAHLLRSRKLGINLFVDRLGSPIGPLGQVDQTLAPANLGERAKADLLAPAPEKAVFEGTLRQSVAGYGAFGIEQRGILLNMDAGLPVGTSFDARKPEQFAEAITKVTTGLAQYPSFRGWSWAANWWIGQRGADAVSEPGRKAMYQAALKRSTETGAWDPILDQVSDVWLGHAVQAEQQFRAVLQKAGKDKRSVMTGPYRAVGVIPPITFRNADEVDLHYQAEQIQPPQVAPHNVDFYKRPGKRAWGHPELWNDDGTGGMIFPTLFQMVMRGADGVGWSGNVPDWGSGASDPRAGGPGAASVYRNLNTLLNHYGPWLTTLENADRVAIVCSSRMLRTDDWAQIGGRYFDRLFEAYNSCLYAHRPASFVFAEDLKPGTLKGYRVVLVVGQRVEFEPELAGALRVAADAGMRIYHDDTCRPERVKGFTPLGIAFNHVDQDPSAWQDDSAYERFPRYFKQNAAVLRRVFGEVVPPVAESEEPEVMLTERRSGEASFVWAVNNVTTGLEPGLAWRVSLLMSNRLPLRTRLKLDGKDKTVYDIFALRAVDAKDGSVEADLRSLPARLFAVLPAPISQVTVRTPRTVPLGREFAWTVSVEDASGRAFKASLPVRVRLLAADGSALGEQYTSASGAEGAKGTFTLPLNSPPGPFVVEAVELISGKTARPEVRSEAPARPAVLTAEGVQPGSSEILPAEASTSGAQTASFRPEETNFGPHLKDLAVSADGSTILLNAFNWDQNLYALDVRTGAVRWRGRVGHHYANAPEAVKDGFAVQGFDLSSAEGYFLYLLGKAPPTPDKGDDAEKWQPGRRFALYGLPKRGTSWAAASQLAERMNHFAVAPDGSWVAAAGDLGLAVWDRDGKLLWSQDWWKKTRQRMPLLAQDGETLITLVGTTATAHRARTGERLWEATLARSGSLLGGVVSGDRRTVAIQADSEGGRVFILREGKLVNTLTTAADAVALAPDGLAVAVTTGNQLKWYAADGGLVWDFTGDDVLRHPRISPDGKRISVCSELGTLYVLDQRGKTLAARDLGALPVAAWLPDGDLIAGTWMGTVVRFDAELKERWRTLLRPTVTDVRPQLLAADGTPTTRRTGWGNASDKPAPLTPNLLRETNALITAVHEPTSHGDPRTWQNPIDVMRDGKPEPRTKPWLGWTDINYIDSGWKSKLTLQVDTFRTQVRLTGVTMVEDPAHPESWMRDVRLQSWDAADGRWRDGPYLLSDAATHTHWFDKPIEAARFRFVSTGGGTWPAGNLRLGEVVFHGEALGCSHPDAVARRPVAVLFDEQEEHLASLKYPGRPFAFRYEGAFSGGKCLALTAEGNTVPAWQPPFGHAVPNWDFEIAEKPGPGQYRYLQFAWKGLSPKTTGMSLLVGRAWPGGALNIATGRYQWPEGVLATRQVSDKIPMEWEVVRVDLWDLYKKPLRIQALGLGTTGGGAAFDQILLGRTPEDLDRVKPAR
jgi:outer membrane protein assembly factor BamB